MQEKIASLGDVEVPEYATLPMQGVATWVNPHNGVEVVVIHYTAAKEKRSYEWFAKTAREYTSTAWKQEMEISFKAFSGLAMYLGFRRSWHVNQSTLDWFPGREMWCGWDEGRHAAVLAQLAENRLYVYGVRQTAGAFSTGIHKADYADQEFAVSGLGEFIDLVKEWREERFPGAAWRDVGDPSIAFQSKRHDGTSEQVFRQHGIKIEMARTNNPTLRTEAVIAWLNYSPGGLPGLIIDPSATMLIDGFAGGYCRDKKGAGTEPEKNAYSHGQDCLQYIVLQLPMSPTKAWESRPDREVLRTNASAEDLRRELRRIDRHREKEEAESWDEW